MQIVTPLDLQRIISFNAYMVDAVSQAQNILAQQQITPESTIAVFSIRVFNKPIFIFNYIN